eukprot:Protomagalhaensia_wolfi_Nauph_80__177@NODE_109_length_3650_cov_30_485738_g82_i0_p1_GENE_NODE_109_length_3650_cov_30_485738_g82_i0NODE_109_length_3650_cov_30_485738_g82_i0_p1_ORF_typecomplete_len496_score137_62Nop/PF01798_18/8_9e77NOP5NT/PF08156_13/2_4e11DUF1168/PF06658_12/0_0036RNA_polI_A34/PF08208_11/0_3Lipase/PF00151_19/16Lipase/PF00151_19/29Med19/PF10278_9/1_4_NODE_109_length_3650_cov_30_485738_g82_i012382725
MSVLILSETSQGYGLFKLKKDRLIEAGPDEVAGEFETLRSAQKAVSLQAFKRFADVREATAEVVTLQDGKVGKVLKSFLKKHVVKAGVKNLGIWDKNLAAAVKKKFDINVILSPSVHEIMRGVKGHMEELVTELGKDEAKVMSMSLSHSLNRFKLKFSPEKVDVMVIQAVGLLDDLDKESNNLAMRLKEWYGFHFPELLKLVTDNSTFAKLVRMIGYRVNVKTLSDFNDLVTSDVEGQIRQAAETSMGSDLVDTDLENIMELAERVLELAAYRASLTDYLRMRMTAIAPNLTYLVGEVLGARLLAQAGSLMDLAKQASSTVQILGAEKALFRALKSKSNTPKYGLLYHAHLVGQAGPKLKGKMARILAAKIQICSRYDAFKENGADEGSPNYAIGLKDYLERRLHELSEGSIPGSSSKPGSAQAPRYTPSRMRNPTEVSAIESSAKLQTAEPELKVEVKEEPPATEEPTKKRKKRDDGEGKEHKKKSKKSKKSKD